MAYHRFGGKLLVNNSYLLVKNTVKNIDNRMFRLIDCMVFNAVSNSILVILRRPLHLSMLSWNSFNRYNILSKPLAAFHHNHCRNNKQLRERNKPPVLKSPTLPTELWGSAQNVQKRLNRCIGCQDMISH